jgi:putative transposase
MWANSIRPESIPLPDDPARLDALLGRAETRTLSHRGIELEGLRYNSAELTELRYQKGEKFEVELRIDDTNLGKIIVLFDGRMFEAFALDKEYADGLGRWQHKVCKNYAAQKLKSFDPSGWLRAKQDIADLIENELQLKKRRSHAKIGRWKDNQPTPAPGAMPAFPQPEKPTPEVKPLLPVAPLPLTAGAPPTESPLPRKVFKPIFRNRSPQRLQEELDEKQGDDE